MFTRGASNSAPARIAIWGRVPPPIGGASVHISRLVPILRQAGYTVEVMPLGSRWREAGRLAHLAAQSRHACHVLFGDSEDLHLVTGQHPLTLLLAAVVRTFRGRSVIYRVGGWSLRSYGLEGTLLQRTVVRFGLRRLDAIIGTGPEIVADVLQLGADRRRVHCIPGFIPSREPEEAPPPEIAAFVAGHGPVLLSSGMVIDPPGEDIYGFRAVLDLTQDLVRDFPRVGVILCCYKFLKVSGSVAALRCEVRERGLADSVLVHESRGALIPSLRVCDVFLRITSEDGDSNAVREALSLGVPVVATDCAARPEPVVVVARGARERLAAATRRVLADLESYRQQARRSSQASTPDQTLELIGQVLRAANRPGSS